MKPALNFIDNYLLLELVQAGRTSELYEAAEVDAEGFVRSVMLKRFIPSLNLDHRVIEKYFKDVERYYPQNEKYFIPILKNAKFRNFYYQVRKMIRGQSLARCIHTGNIRNSPLSLELNVYIIWMLADSLRYFESLSASSPSWARYHGHLTPDNILISYEGDLWLLNYSLDWLQPLYREQGGLMPIKYLPYSSPELLRQEQLDIRSDFFSMGTIIAEMFTGKKLFYDHDPEIIRQLVCQAPREKINQLGTLIPRKIMTLCTMLLDADSANRCGEAAQIEEIIADVIDLENTAKYALKLKNYMHSLFQNEINEELKKLKHHQEKYSKSLGISLDGEDKFLEPTNVVNLNDLQKKESGEPSHTIPEEEAESMDSVLDLLSPFEEKTEPTKPFTPNDIEHFLDTAVKEILTLKKDEEGKASEPEEVTPPRIHFNLEWMAIEKELDQMHYDLALDKLVKLQQHFPQNPKVKEKIQAIQNLLERKRQSTLTATDVPQNMQEHTQPMEAISLSDQIAGVEHKERKSRRDSGSKKSLTAFSVVNAVLWFLMVLVIVLIALVLLQR